MSFLAYVVPSVLRNMRRTGAYLVGTVIAVGLLSSVLFFVVASSRVLTQRSISPVRVDMQAVATDPKGSVTNLTASLSKQPGIATAKRFALASFAGAEVRYRNRIGQTGSGRIMAVDPSYLSTFGVPNIRDGKLSSKGAVISFDLGTNLGARVGDALRLTFAHGVRPVTLRITGIANMNNTDVLFAPVDPLLRANPFNPPVNVVIMDYSLFERTLKGPLLTHSQSSTPNGAVVLRNNSPVLEQVHLRVDRGQVPADPSQARTYTTTLRHRLEAAYPGRVAIFDNLFAALDQAQADVLWAQAIFVFLALPGLVLAASLARYVTSSVIEAERRELALLRIRGVGPRQLLTLLGSSLLLVALFGVLLGLGAGWVTTRVAAGTALLANASGQLVVKTMLFALVAGFALGAVSTFWPLAEFVRLPIVQGQRRVGRATSPLWSRLYLDIVCLIVAGAVYWVTQRNGFAPLLNAEGNPTISLSIFTFLAPLLFWIGAILLLVRISRGLVSRSGRLLGRFTKRGGVVSELLGRTLHRRSGSLHQAVVLVAMAVAFSAGLVTFVHTYDQQQKVDAELTLGADVKVNVLNRAQSPAVERRLSVAGVQVVTPFRTTVAYVGSEIQDIFGVQVRSFLSATRLSDSFFVGSSAAATMNRLQGTPNGIVVSAETARDYSLNMGDSLILRLLNSSSHRYVATKFKLVGVAKEFATAPKDAFLVANLSYLQSVTGGGGINTFLIKTSSSPSAVAKSLRAQFAHGPAVHVAEIGGVQQALSTSLTSLNLSALSSINYFYTLVMVITGLLVFILAVLLERRRDFAMLQVLGVTGGQIRRLLLGELGYAVAIGCLLGFAVGLIFAAMLVQILQSIFDPPPSTIAIPWNSLGLILAIVVAGGLVAWAVASQRLAKLNISSTLREM
jgi:putative ABC transport system permease protein